MGITTLIFPTKTEGQKGEFVIIDVIVPDRSVNGAEVALFNMKNALFGYGLNGGKTAGFVAGHADFDMRVKKRESQKKEDPGQFEKFHFALQREHRL